MYDFIKWNPSEVLEGAISKFEETTGESLYAGDERRIILNSFIYMATILANKANYLANQQLVETMDEEHLLKYGESIGVVRKQAEKATVMMQFTLATVSRNEVFIPRGTRVTPNGLLFFETVIDDIIKPGDLTATIQCIATESGTVYNDFRIGDISTITDAIPYVNEVSNISLPMGGVDLEDIESYRNRVSLRPWNYSTGGTENSYKYVVLAANNLVASCTVISRENDPSIADSTVVITCVGNEGELLEESIIKEVEEYVNRDDIRVQNDIIIVQSPTVVEYDIELEYFIDEADRGIENEIKAAVEAAIDAYIIYQDSEIGRVINPNVLQRDIIKAGAFDVKIITPGIQRINKMSIPKIRNRDVRYNGIFES